MCIYMPVVMPAQAARFLEAIFVAWFYIARSAPIQFHAIPDTRSTFWIRRWTPARSRQRVTAEQWRRFTALSPQGAATRWKYWYGKWKSMSWLRHVQFRDQSDERRGQARGGTSDLFRPTVLNDYRQMIAPAELLKDTISGNSRMVISPGATPPRLLMFSQRVLSARNVITLNIFDGASCFS